MTDIAALGFGVDSSGLIQAQTQLDRLSSKSKTTETRVTRASQKMSAGFGTLRREVAGLLAGFTALTVARKTIFAFAEFERGLVGVAKTANLTEAELSQLESGINSLGRALPVPRRELLAIGQAAGQLGVTGVDNILLFTETVAKLGTASDLAGEEAATSLTRILNVTGEGIDRIDEFASVIVALGNNFAATESEIARVSTEVARSTAVFGVSSDQVAAISTALKALGVQAQLGGSAVGRAFRTIDNAVRNGGLELRKLSEITGITGGELKRVFEEDSARAFQLFIEGLGRVAKSGGDVTAELASLGLRGDEVLKVLPVLAQRADILARALGIAGDEAKNATALNEEFLRSSKTLSSQMGILANALDEAFAAIGKVVSPAVLGAINTLGSGLNFVSENLGIIGRAVAILVVSALLPWLGSLYVAARAAVGQMIALEIALGAGSKSAAAFGASVKIATLALRTLGRVVAIGLLVEGLIFVVDKFNEIDDILKKNSVSWGAYARVSVDSFVNNTINGLVVMIQLFKRFGDNAIDIIQTALSVAFDFDIIKKRITGELDAAGARKIFFNALAQTIGKDFADFDDYAADQFKERWLKLASDADIAAVLRAFADPSTPSGKPSETVTRMEEVTVTAKQPGVSDIFGGGFGTQFEQQLKAIQDFRKELTGASNDVSMLDASIFALGAKMADIFGPGGMLSAGISDAIAQAIVFGDSFNDVLRAVGQQILSSIISSIIQIGVNWALTQAFMKATSSAALATTVGENVAAAATLTAAYAPAAAAASVATAGGSAVAGFSGAALAITGIIALLAGVALGGGFKNGGFTGNGGIDDVAGVVHGREFVFDAAATSRIGVNNLESMRRGKMPASAQGVSGSGDVNISIENYGTSKEFDVQKMDEGRIRIIARDEAQGVVRKETPGLVSNQVRDPNSSISKSLNQNLQAQRRR